MMAATDVIPLPSRTVSKEEKVEYIKRVRQGHPVAHREYKDGTRLAIKAIEKRWHE